jgi:aflatoxin B1 aldehyde reductase
MPFKAFNPLAAGFNTGKATAVYMEGTSFDAPHPFSPYIRVT